MSITIAPDDSDLLYSPFNWDRTSVRALAVNGGAYIKAAFQGTPTAMLFDMSAYGAEKAQIAWRIDGGPWSHAVVAASVPLAMPSDNAWDRHLVEIVVKSTSQVGSRWNFALTNAVRFLGFTAADGTTTLPITRRPLTVVVHGDSITEGLRTLGSANLDNPTFDSDATRCWSWLLGDLLGAEVGVVGFAGQGWTSPGSGFVPPFPEAWDQIYDGCPRPVVDPVAPDVKVINLGTNDHESIFEAAMATLTEMLAAYPSSRLVIMRPFHGDREDELQAVVAALANPRVTYLDTTGWWSGEEDTPIGDGVHPLGYPSLTKLAPLVAAGVRSALSAGGSSGRFIMNGSGDLVAI